MNEKDLVVTLPGTTVGVLSQNQAGLVKWLPDAPWEAANQHPRLGLAFLRSRGPQSHASDLPAWFENLLPERTSPLRQRLCQLHGLRDGQSFALLRVLGHDLIGAVEVINPTSTTATEMTSGPVGRPPHVENAPGDTNYTDKSALRLSALTGMQLKFSMSMVDDRLILPAIDSASQWIVKFPGAEFEELAQVEHATMSWARAAGFNVPDHKVVNVAELDGIPTGWTAAGCAFAVKRFDRRSDGSKVHQEDLCQALQLRSADKYGDGNERVSFEGALRLVIDACGETEGREMARRVGFMIASGNSDAHLKNWSLLWGDRVSPILTPSYDLVATIAWRDKLGWGLKGGPTLALALGGQKEFRQLNNTALQEATQRVGVAWLSDEVRDGIERAKRAWKDIEQTTPSRMCKAVAEHWDAVPLLATFNK